MLEDEFEIDESEDGDTALTSMPQKRPDLILLDISLPGMDGTEVLEQTNASPLADVPTVASTAHAMDGDRERFLSLGFDDYLSKPIVDEQDLLRMIRRLMAHEDEPHA